MNCIGKITLTPIQTVEVAVPKEFHHLIGDPAAKSCIMGGKVLPTADIFQSKRPALLDVCCQSVPGVLNRGFVP